MFSSFYPVHPGSWPVKGIGSDADPLQAAGFGDIHVRVRVNEEWHDGVFSKVLFVPNLGANLFSVGAAASRGVIVSFVGEKVIIACGRKTIAVGASRNRKLYILDAVSKGSSPCLTQAPAISLLSRTVAEPVDLWHHRLGHVYSAVIKKMETLRVVDGLVLTKPSCEFFCEGCVYGKHHRQPFPTDGRRRGKQIGDIIHSDVVGPNRVPSPNGAKYFVIFKDDYSGYSEVKFLKQKSEVPDLFKVFVNRLEVETGQRVNTLRSDNGGEYESNEFSQWLESKGIRHETSVAETPEQNGVAERQNRTVIESARCMLHSTGRPLESVLELWAEATNCAVYLRNRVLAKALEGKTPYEAWTGRKPNLSHIRVFGCTAYAHIPHDERSKFAPNAIKCLFVGYCETQKGFRLWDPVGRRLRISRDVKFHEVIPSVAVSPLGAICSHFGNF